ncbi:MAG: hypothetical protein WCP93_01295 [Candidatus Berkelbacteria bacterium]
MLENKQLNFQDLEIEMSILWPKLKFLKGHPQELKELRLMHNIEIEIRTSCNLHEFSYNLEAKSPRPKTTIRFFLENEKVRIYSAKLLNSRANETMLTDQSLLKPIFENGEKIIYYRWDAKGRLDLIHGIYHDNTKFYYSKFKNTFFLQNNTPLKLPATLDRCKNILRVPIDWQIDIAKETDLFIKQMGLLSFSKKIQYNWPCQMCQRAFISHGSVDDHDFSYKAIEEW